MSCLYPLMHILLEQCRNVELELKIEKKCVSLFEVG